MKKRVWATVLAAILIGSLMLFAACGGNDDGEGNTPEVEPKLKAGAATEFELDAWSQASNYTKILKFEDYFDATGATGVTYDVKTSDSTKVSVSKSSANATMRGVAAGSATVTLSVKQNNAEKLKVDLSVTVVDTTPAQYTVTGLGPRYASEAPDAALICTVEGNAKAVERSAYNFKIVTGDYMGIPVVDYKVGSGESKTLDDGKENPTNTFSFSIPVAEVTAPIEIGDITGLVPRATFAAAIDSGVVQTGYVLTVPDTAVELKPFVFKAVLNFGYYPNEDAKITYKVADGDKPLSEIEAKELKGNKVGNEVTFTVPAAEVTGGITVYGYEGLVQLTSYSVTGLGDKTGYTVVGADSCIENFAYYFTVDVDTDHMVADKIEATYQVGEKAEKTAEGKLIDSYNQIYEFLIYRKEVTANTEIKAITGVTADPGTFKEVALSVTEANNLNEFTLLASPKAYTDADYTFSIEIPSYYEEKAVVNAVCTVDTEAASLVAAEPVSNGLFTTYAFTLSKDDLDDGIDIAVTLDVGSIQRIKNLLNPFYQAGSWDNLASGYGENDKLPAQAKPTDNSGALKFTDTVIRSATNATTAPDGTAVSTAWNQASFEVMSAGTIDMLLFSTTNTRVISDGMGGYKWSSGDNWVRLYTDDRGYLNLTTCQATVNTVSGTLSGALGSVDVGGIYKTEFMRIDVLYRTLVPGNDATTEPAASENPGRMEIRLFVNGVWVELEPSVEQEWSRIVDGNLITSIRRPNYGHRAAVWARGGEANSIYVQNVTPPAAPAGE